MFPSSNYTSPLRDLGDSLGIDTRTVSEQERDRLARNTTYIQQAAQRMKGVMQAQEAARVSRPLTGGPYNPLNVPM